jgi:hypothetical protein
MPFVLTKVSLQHSIDTPNGKVILSEVNTRWFNRHRESENTIPYHEITVTSAEASATPAAFAEMNRVFEQLRSLKKQLDTGARQKNDSSLRAVVDGVSDLYWIMSQAWPYGRGSAGVADLVAKLAFDWFDIRTPRWKDNENPNIIALLTPQQEFRSEYATMYAEDLTWRQ